MPLVKRAVSPVNISQVPVPKNIQNDLEFIFNSSLCNLIRQLASLSRQADDLFADLTIEVNSLSRRTQALNSRVNTVCESMDIAIRASLEHGAEISDLDLQDVLSNRVESTLQTVDRSTMPKCLELAYKQCEPPPPLEIMNKFRVDGKDSAKLYSDPSFFFELWRIGILKEEPLKARKKKKKSNKTRRKNKKEQLEPELENAMRNSTISGSVHDGHSTPNVTSANVIHANGNDSLPDHFPLPSPPLSNSSLFNPANLPPPSPVNYSEQIVGGLVGKYTFEEESPYAPGLINLPPPDPLEVTSVRQPSPPLIVNLPIEPPPQPPVPQANPLRSSNGDFLQAIISGHQLRRVEPPPQQTTQKTMPKTVQQLLEEVERRRVAIGAQSSGSEDENSDFDISE